MLNFLYIIRLLDIALRITFESRDKIFFVSHIDKRKQMFYNNIIFSKDVIIMENEKSITLINEELDVVKNEEENIKNLIYTIRGKQVMLDSDVAKLYHYKTKSLNLAVKRNIDRFPEEFCFQLNENELESLRFQIETSKIDNKEINNSRGGRRYLPYVFTEQGIAMLAGILKNDIAVDISIKIIRTFISMRKFLIQNGQVFERLSILEYKQLENEKNFRQLFDIFKRENNFN